MTHITVLETEAVDALQLNANSVVVDCTLGSGGHAREILKRLGSEGVYVGFDADETAIDMQSSLADEVDATVHLVHANFSTIKDTLEKLHIKPDAILADLGWRTEQFQEGKKGFSFSADEPLLMTYGSPESHVFTAYDIVNEWEEESIADVIYGYGEERSSRRIAKAIVAARAVSPIKTAIELASIIEQALPTVRKGKRTHPATKTFQALRIAVNDELGVIKTLLEDGFDLLNENGHMVIISFHSLEDRIVKQFFREKSRDHTGELLTKKPIIASREATLENPRARSAKLRIIKKL